MIDSPAATCATFLRRLTTQVMFAALLLGFVTPTAAQVIKPLNVEPDPNGVDMLAGKAAPRPPTLSIPAAPRLSFTRLYDWHLVLEGEAIQGTYGTETYSINTLRQSSESFTCPDGNYCDDQKKEGAYLVPDRWSGNNRLVVGKTAVEYLYTIRDKQQGAIQAGSKFYFLGSSVTFPDGETLWLNWQERSPTAGFKEHRLSSVVSSTGYQLTFTYVSNDPANWAWMKLQSASIGTTGGPALASLTYSDTTVTDIAGRVYTCIACTGVNGLESATSLTLPQEPGPTFSATATTANHGGYTHNRFTTQVATDGVSYNYAYIQAGYNLGSPNVDVVDLMTVTGPGGFVRTVDVESGSMGTSTISRVKSVTDSSGAVTSFGYGNQFNQLTSITYPEGNSVQLTYDGPNITSLRQKAKPGSGLPDLVQTASYAPWNQFNFCHQITCFLPNSTQDAKGNQTDYTWATHGGLLTQLDPVDANGQRRKVKFTYDGLYRPIREEVCAANTAGAELTCGTANAFVKQTTYFNYTRLPLTETVTDGVGTAPLTTSYTYDAAGRMLSKDGPLPGSNDATYYIYDSLGRRIWEIGAANQAGQRPATLTSYRNADDQPWKVESGYVTSPSAQGWTPVSQSVTTFNDRRLAVRMDQQQVSPSLATLVLTQKSYDARNREECVAVRMNAAAFASLPASACSLGPAGADGPDRITRNVYDADSQLLKVQKAYGTSLQQDYATYTYSANGKQRSLTDARGYRAEMEYDGFDRQTKWIFPSKTTTGVVDPTDYEQYAYDANGNRISLRKRDGSTLTYQYDNLNRVTRKTVPERAGLAAMHTRDVFYEYDIRGLETKARFDSLGGDGITTAYDAYGRATSATISMAGLTRTLTSAYDAGSRRTRLTHPDGVYFDLQYDPAGRLTGGLWTAPGSSNYSFMAQSFDGLGRRTLVTRGAPGVGQTSYAYDPLSRLTTQSQAFSGATHNVSHGFAYNPASQIVSRTQSNDGYRYTGHIDVNRTYATNGLNQYATVGAASYTYDANGNLTFDGTRSYLYDVENRLVSASDGAELVYDPKGRMFQISKAGQVTRFVHDGDQMALEYDSAGAVTRRHLFAGVDEPVLEASGAALSCTTARFPHANHQGSIIAQADCAGSRTAVNAYDEYGIPQAGNVGRFQYTGQAWLPEIGMYYYKARIYSPTLGRFLQVDPIGYDDQVNLYAYVGNDPVNSIDVSGKETGSVAYRSVVSLTQATKEVNQSKVPADKIKTAQIFLTKYLALRLEGYDDKRKSGWDKALHCEANCQAAAISPEGESAAKEISDLREKTTTSTPQDEAKDQKANEAGRKIGHDLRDTGTPSEKVENQCKTSCAAVARDIERPR